MQKVKATKTTKSRETRITARYKQIDVWQNRAARLLLILMMCGVPLYLSKNRYLYLAYDKYSFLVLFVSLIIAACALIWIVRIAKRPRLFPRDRLEIADYAVLAFAAVTILSALISPYRFVIDVWEGFENRHDGAITQLLYVAIYFIISRWYKPNEKDFIIFAITACIVSLIGIFQFYGMDFLGLWTGGTANNYNINYRTTLGNVNMVSTFICIAVLFCGFLYVKTDNDKKPQANNNAQEDDQSAKDDLTSEAGNIPADDRQNKWHLIFLAGSALSFWMLDIANSDSGLVGILAATFLAAPFIIENKKTIGRFDPDVIMGSSIHAANVPVSSEYTGNPNSKKPAPVHRRSSNSRRSRHSIDYNQRQKRTGRSPCREMEARSHHHCRLYSRRYPGDRIPRQNSSDRNLRTLYIRSKRNNARQHLR